MINKLDISSSILKHQASGYPTKYTDVFKPELYNTVRLHGLNENTLDEYLKSGYWFNSTSTVNNILSLMEEVSNINSNVKNRLINETCKYLTNTPIVEDWSMISEGKNDTYKIDPKFEEFLNEADQGNKLAYTYYAADNTVDFDGAMSDIVSVYKKDKIKAGKKFYKLMGNIEDLEIPRDRFPVYINNLIELYFKKHPNINTNEFKEGMFTFLYLSNYDISGFVTKFKDNIGKDSLFIYTKNKAKYEIAKTSNIYAQSIACKCFHIYNNKDEYLFMIENLNTSSSMVELVIHDILPYVTNPDLTESISTYINKIKITPVKNDHFKIKSLALSDNEESVISALKGFSPAEKNEFRKVFKLIKDSNTSTNYRKIGSAVEDAYLSTFNDGSAILNKKLFALTLLAIKCVPDANKVTAANCVLDQIIINMTQSDVLLDISVNTHALLECLINDVNTLGNISLNNKISYIYNILIKKNYNIKCDKIDNFENGIALKLLHRGYDFDNAFAHRIIQIIKNTNMEGKELVYFIFSNLKLSLDYNNVGTKAIENNPMIAIDCVRQIRTCFGSLSFECINYKTVANGIITAMTFLIKEIKRIFSYTNGDFGYTTNADYLVSELIDTAKFLVIHKGLLRHGRYTHEYDKLIPAMDECLLYITNIYKNITKHPLPLIAELDKDIYLGLLQEINLAGVDGTMVKVILQPYYQYVDEGLKSVVNYIDKVGVENDKLDVSEMIKHCNYCYFKRHKISFITGFIAFVTNPMISKLDEKAMLASVLESVREFIKVVKSADDEIPPKKLLVCYKAIISFIATHHISVLDSNDIIVLSNAVTSYISNYINPKLPKYSVDQLDFEDGYVVEYTIIKEEEEDDDEDSEVIDFTNNDDEDIEDDEEDEEDETKSKLEEDDDWEVYKDPGKKNEAMDLMNIMSDNELMFALVYNEAMNMELDYYNKGILKIFSSKTKDKMRYGFDNKVNISESPYKAFSSMMEVLVEHEDDYNNYITNKMLLEQSKPPKEPISEFMQDMKLVKLLESDKPNKINIVKDKLSSAGKSVKDKIKTPKSTKVLSDKISSSKGELTSKDMDKVVKELDSIKSSAGDKIKSTSKAKTSTYNKIDNLLNKTVNDIKKHRDDINRERLLNGKLLPSLSSMIKIAVSSSAFVALGQPILGMITLIGGIGMNSNTTKRAKMEILDNIDIQKRIINKKIQECESSNNYEEYETLLKIKKRLEKEEGKLLYKTSSGRFAHQKALMNKSNN